MRYAAILSAAMLAAPMAVLAQVTTVDEGSFTIFRGGAKVGRETFSIRRTSGPGGDVLVANATVQLGAHRLSPALRTDGDGDPLAYQVEVRTGTEIEERLSGQIGRGRFSAHVKTPRGESAKEYIVSNGALVLDDDVFHQYYFLAHANRTGMVPVVIPRRNVQISMRVESVGPDRVTIGGQAIAGRHLTLTQPDGAVRDVWVDAEGRVLKVELGASGLTAIRDAPPA